jgi:WD40 repeat protein
MSFACRFSIVLTIVVSLPFGQRLLAQAGKDKGVSNMDGPVAVPLAIKPGEPLSEMAMVTKPAPIRGALGWTVETKIHRGAPTSFSVSADGTIVATGGFDGVIRLWDAASGKLLRALVGHSSSVYDVAFSPDGSLLASTGYLDNTARIWNPKTGMTVRIFKNHKSFTSKLAWSPDGKKLVVIGGASGFATFWDTAQNKHLRTIEQGVPINGVAWSPDGKIVACATSQGAVLLNAADGANLSTLRMNPNNILAVAWSPDSKFLLTGGIRSTVIWDAVSAKTIGTLNWTGRFLSWSPDGEKIATGYTIGMQTFNGNTHFHDKGYEIGAIGFAWEKKTGDLFVLTSTEVQRIDLKDEAAPRKFTVAAGDTLAWSPGRPVISGLNEKTLKLWDAVTGKPTAELSGHTETIFAAAWSADGKLLATGSKDMTAKVWDGKTGKLLRSLAGHTKPVKGVAWSPEGKLATASEDMIVRVFPADSDKPVELKGHTKPVQAVAWSRYGKLASGGDDGKVHLWNLETGKPAKSLDVHHDVFAIVFSPDGNLLGVGGSDDVARLFNVTAGTLTNSLDAKTGRAEYFNLAWSPDGSLVATTNYRLHLWNAKTETALHGYQMAGPVQFISFTPDGRTTVAGCLDRVVRFCETSSGLLRGTLVDEGKQLIAISAEGHYKAAPDIENELIYVVQTDKSQDIYDLKTFPGKFGWKNNPAAVKLLGN